METYGKVYFLHGTFLTKTNSRSLNMIVSMKYYILAIILTLPLTLLPREDERQEINEGHLYQEERENKVFLREILGEDPNKAYTNCFETKEEEKQAEKDL